MTQGILHILPYGSQPADRRSRYSSPRKVKKEEGRPTIGRNPRALDMRVHASPGLNGDRVPPTEVDMSIVIVVSVVLYVIFFFSRSFPKYHSTAKRVMRCPE